MKILRGLLIIILVLLSFITFILFTHPGLNTTLFAARRLIPGELAIKQTHGTLSSHFTLNDFIYRNQTILLTCDTAEINWNIFTLFEYGKINVYNFTLKNLKIIIPHVVRAPTPSPSPLTDTFKKLRYFNLFQFNVNSIKLQYAEHPYFINSLQINQTMTNYYFEVYPLHGSLIGYIDIAFKPALTWKTQWDGQQLNVHDVFPAMTGLINFTAHSQGTWQQGLFENTQLTLDHLNGTFNNQPIQVKFDVALNQHDIYFNQAYVNLANASATLQGFLNPKKANVSWNLTLPQLSAFSSKFTGNLLFKGQLYKQDKYYLTSDLLGKDIKIADVQIKQIQGQATTQLSNEVSNINLKINHLVIAHYVIPTSTLSLNANVNYPKLETNAVLDLNHNNQLSATMNFKINAASLQETPISGTVKVNFKALTALINANTFKNFSGLIDGTFNITGTIASPRFSGDINLLNGHLALPQLGITPRAIFIKSHFNQYRPIDFNGSFHSGVGQAQIKGHIDLYHPNLPFTLKFVGNNLQVLNLPEYQMRVSPNIDLSNKAGFQYLDMQGTLTIPYINIKTNTVSQAVTLPPEIEVVGSNINKPFIKPSNMNIHLTLILGNHINVAYQHLLAKLSGQLTINQLPGGFPIAFGTLYVNEGSYYLYNQFLTIKNGRLIYFGNEIRNPLLNLRAIKNTTRSTFAAFTANEKTTSQAIETENYVGALVQGTLLNPKVTLISNPPMSQNDILSYLLFGEPMNQVSGNPLSMLSTASSALNLLPPNASDGTAPTSPLTTGIMKLGAFNPIQAFNFTHPLSKHFSFKSESSIEEVGADLIYHYDKD